MPGATVHFLLVYSYDEQTLVRQDEFTDPREATAAYSKAEREFSGQTNFEIVLVGSDSIETVMKTHGHYFRSETSSIFSDFLTTAAN
jgi:hypothetical protein